MFWTLVDGSAITSLDAFLEDPGLISQTRRQLTTLCNTSSGRYDALFYMHIVHRYTYIQDTHTYKTRTKSLKNIYVMFYLVGKTQRVH